jgi:hypothetical protein
MAEQIVGSSGDGGYSRKFPVTAGRAGGVLMAPTLEVIDGGASDTPDRRRCEAPRFASGEVVLAELVAYTRWSADRLAPGALRDELQRLADDLAGETPEGDDDPTG